MADAQTTAPAPAPALDGGADPTAHELPGGQQAGEPDSSAAAAADPGASAAAPAPADSGTDGSTTPDPNEQPPAARVRFEEVTKRARQWEQQARESDRRLQQALTALERAAPSSMPPAPAPAEEQEPAPPVFETPEQYQRDMAQYARDLAELTAKRQVKAERAEAERARMEGEQGAYQQRVNRSYSEGRAAAIAEIPDYEETAESPDVSISVPMAHAIVLLEHKSKGQGTKVQYYLGKNPAEAARIAALPVAEQPLEIGMLVSKALAAFAPKPPARTQAPAPIKPLSGGATPASKSTDDMSMEEYAAHRAKR